MINKTLFDLRPIQESANGFMNGGSEYCKALLDKMIEHSAFKHFDVAVDKKLNVQDELIHTFEKNNVKILHYQDHIELSRIANMYARFYSALPYDYFDLDLCKDTTFIMTIHGLRAIELPFDSFAIKYNHDLHTIIKGIVFYTFPNILLSKYIEHTRRLLTVTKNKKIIVVSNHTKFSLLSRFSEINSDELKVLYSPHKTPTIEINGVSKYQNYFLMVSGDRWTKNNLRAAIAVDQLLSDYKIDNTVVITGVKNPNVYLKHIKNRNKFIFLKYVETDELELLYRDCRLFIYPSLNEGFGYPPLEVMKYNKISICAADTSITEACGDAVLYFNPYDIGEIKTRVLEALDTVVFESMKSKITQQYAKISTKQEEDLIELMNTVLDIRS